MAGCLYLVATPIGNLEDMTYRAVRILQEADLIAAEDTRDSMKLLRHFEIHTPMTAYHEFNKIDKARVLIGKMRAGETIACITDAGTPGISDPGEELTRMCYEAGISVYAIPGPAAVITAVTSSGLPCRRFAFEAFLPRDKKEKKRILEELRSESRTMVIYEAPHRLRQTLADLAEALGPERKLTVARELTKKHEEKARMTLGQSLDYYRKREPRGEYVLVVEGKSWEETDSEGRARWEEMDLDSHMQIYLDQGLDRKEAMKAVARDRGIPKREVYAALLKET
ncbi:16S rRNA (cytidine(1402)-2'-O)-methyltransferase [Shuttleworthella satelles]|uniref:16S rRNA (cytidine(1402)-2'-O)-methyltransferase n=1 Tax=Shuttleworthella satelles TaxID=177972 RepID=UPI0028D526B0|nr:16S rRNA (cytidine(1402)-2'-O)-methyltransferase [Shuttleworthia satelles]